MIVTVAIKDGVEPVVYEDVRAASVKDECLMIFQGSSRIGIPLTQIHDWKEWS